jgi:dienelactone hydrolase
MPFCLRSVSRASNAGRNVIEGDTVESDDWTTAEACRKLASQQENSGTPIDLKVYPGAFHGFNFPQAKPRRKKGVEIEKQPPDGIGR